MKRSLTVAALVVAIALIPPQARPEPPPKCIVVFRCVTVIVLSAAGGVITFYVKRWCDRVFSNHNWQLTNVDTYMAPLYSGSTGPGTSTVQSATGTGSLFVDEKFSVNLQQERVGTNDWQVATLFSNAIPVCTNRALITTNNDPGQEPIVFDFVQQTGGTSTNRAPSRMFRLLN